MIVSEWVCTSSRLESELKQKTVHPAGGSNEPTFKVIRTSKQNEPVVTPLTIATPTLADLSLCRSVLLCVLTVARLTPISLAPFSPRPAKWEKPAGEEPFHTPAPGLSGKLARCVLVYPLPTHTLTSCRWSRWQEQNHGHTPTSILKPNTPCSIISITIPKRLYFLPNKSCSRNLTSVINKSKIKPQSK